MKKNPRAKWPNRSGHQPLGTGKAKSGAPDRIPPHPRPLSDRAGLATSGEGRKIYGRMGMRSSRLLELLLELGLFFPACPPKPPQNGVEARVGIDRNFRRQPAPIP